MQNSSENSILFSHAEKLIRAHDGVVALLYLWETVNHERIPEKAAEDLCLTMADVTAGFEKLDRMGISHVSAPAVREAGKKQDTVLPEPESLPEYTAEDIKSSMEDGRFQAVVDETKSVLGRGLNTAELKKLFGIYDHLGLPADVILELVNYCAETTIEKYGPSRKTSFRTIENEAYYWINHNILSFEAAEEFIRVQKKKHSLMGELQAQLGISGRELTDTEKKYINSWLDLGFDSECIHEAYERTVIKTGSLKWAYMDRILQNWNEKGFKTIKDIREKDTKLPKAPAHTGSMSSGGKIDYEAVQNILKNDSK